MNSCNWLYDMRAYSVCVYVSMCMKLFESSLTCTVHNWLPSSMGCHRQDSLGTTEMVPAVTWEMWRKPSLETDGLRLNVKPTICSSTRTYSTLTSQDPKWRPQHPDFVRSYSTLGFSAPLWEPVGSTADSEPRHPPSLHCVGSQRDAISLPRTQFRDVSTLNTGGLAMASLVRKKGEFHLSLRGGDWTQALIDNCPGPQH